LSGRLGLCASPADASAGKARVSVLKALSIFDYEITLLTVPAIDGTSFCEAESGTAKEAWRTRSPASRRYRPTQPLAEITAQLRWQSRTRWWPVPVFGRGIVYSKATTWFQEVSPRPHDTAMVTLIPQDLSRVCVATPGDFSPAEIPGHSPVWGPRPRGESGSG